MAPDFTDIPSGSRPRLSEIERRHHLAVLEEHGGTQLTSRCPIHGMQLCVERVSAWNALAGDRLLPTVDDELAVVRRAE